MVTSLALSVLVTVLCFGYNHALPGRKMCRYRSVGGNIETFFGTLDKGSTFPCSYLLAGFTCGNAKTVVRAENAVNEKGDIVIDSVSVEITSRCNGNKYTQINTVSAAQIEKFVKERKWDKNLWRYSTKGPPAPEEHKIRGSYNRRLRAAFVEYDALRVDYKIDSSTVTVLCEENSISRATPYPRTLCGSPNNTLDIVESIDGALPVSEEDNDLTMARLDYMQLARMEAEQKEDECREASDIVTDECPKRGDQLYKCHMFYSPFENAKYGKCMRKHDIDAFKAYIACVRILCGGKGVEVPKKECRLLKQVSEECGELKLSPIQVSELLDIGQCGVKEEDRVTPEPVTTESPPPDPGAGTGTGFGGGW